MGLGYDEKLFILAFDHRGSFVKRFGIEGDPTAEEIERLNDGKHLIFEGVETALGRGADPSVTGVLVDEQFGAPSGIPERAKAKGIKLAMPVEKSGQNEFDFEYGDEFGAHIERFDPDFSKVLVRYNPEGDAAMNERQAGRLARLSDWLHERDRKFLFELLVPAEEAQLAAVDGNAERYDAEMRPDLMIRAIAELQDAGVEPDIWKIEGVDAASRLRADRRPVPCWWPRRRRLHRPRAGCGRQQGRPLAARGRARSRSTSASRSVDRSGATPWRASSAAASRARMPQRRSRRTTCGSSTSTPAPKLRHGEPQSPPSPAFRISPSAKSRPRQSPPRRS